MFRTILKLCTLLLLFSGPTTWAQLIKPNLDGDYGKILDIAFPRPQPMPSRFILTVRYQPSFGHEVQVAIRRTVANDYEIELLRIPGSDLSVWERYYLARQNRVNIRPETFAKQIRVERMQVKLSDKDVERLLIGFSNVVLDFDHKSVAETYDGIRYQIWFDSLDIGLYWSTNVGGYRTAHSPPVARWADELLEACERAAKD